MAINRNVEETLSALMDGEASELEIRRTLRDISEDAELRRTWQRYQLASAAMKRDLPPRVTDLSSRISAAIEQESTPKSSLSSLLPMFGKVAIAASVTLVAVLGVQQIQLTNTSQQLPKVAASSAAATGNSQFQLPAGYDLPPVTARTVSAGSVPQAQSRPTVLVSPRSVVSKADEEAIRDYLDGLMQQHTENAAQSLSSQGLLPFARLPQDGDNVR
ncbi:MAG: sigma-E factor negative regulatory protein [Porticoccaceae bacterium]|jgi:sigma-E factor negative regulatory protein RseA